MLVWHEMDWTVLFFMHQAKAWEARQISPRTSGHLHYALRMGSMWMRFATRASEAFTLVKERYPSPVQTLVI
jgi:hypothetical protein